ncbi:SgcJ/EcaC family oxidoreductase [Streptomyces phaeochromogenes]|uniref:SgcJ/EcaC family oxidoreductase n=1 Tax=Streptomyces phaeochromogenes TaxID=1923 RepID=UPI003400339C
MSLRSPASDQRQRHTARQRHPARRTGLRRPLALAATAVFALATGANAATAPAPDPAGGHLAATNELTEPTGSGGSGGSGEAAGSPEATGSAGSALPQLKRLIQRQADAWNRGDGTAFANTYAEDAEFITFDGTHLRGRPEMARNFQIYFDNYTKGTRLVFTKVPVTLRYPMPTTAVMITNGCVANPGEPECRPDSHSVQTYVAAHRERGWELVSFQNTRVQNLLPPPRT